MGRLMGRLMGKQGNSMGKTRAFGNIKYRPSSQHPTRLVASYPTPPSAFSRWPSLPKRQSKSFPVTAEEDAIGWLNNARKRLDAGVWEPESVIKQKDEASTLTFGEYFPEWLAHHTAKGNPLKPSTRRKLQKDVEHHVLPYFGDTRLIDITQDMVDRWLETLPHEQKSMRENSYKALKEVLRTASKPGIHGEQPLIPQYPITRSLPKPERYQETVPATPREIKIIHDAMPARYAIAIYLSVFGDGLRIGEVCALQRRDIDLEGRIMYIRRGRVTMDPNSKISTPKTRSSVRKEFIPPQLLPMLKKFLDENVRQEPEAWLLPARKDDSQPLHPNTLRHWYDEARKAAGRPDLRFHDLRHTGLTWMAEDGATLKELMEAAGHKDVSVAMRYQHSVDDRRQMLAEKMGARLLPDDTPEIVLARIKALDEKIATLEKQRGEEKKKLADLLG
jgi:integrase